MAGYLIDVDYEVLGVAGQMLVGIADGSVPDEATAITAAVTLATNYRASRGETITDVSAVVIEIR